MKEFSDYQKKPVVIQAVQIGTLKEARSQPEICTGGLGCNSIGAPEDSWPHIHTLEGDHSWTAGDWLIRGVKGEHYFCKPDIFEMTYQRPTAIEPIDVILFCPKCRELHIDHARPDRCENCGQSKTHHDLRVTKSNGSCPEGFKAWLNPPHKSHRCGNCNFVWRPADVPTNGVAHAKTKGDNDTTKIIGDIRRANRAA